MKNVMTTLLLMISFCATGFAQNHSINDLIGTWEAVSEINKDGGLQVVDSSKIFLVYKDQKMPVVNYKADFTKTPAWFDFTIKDSTEEIHLKSLIQFVNDDLVQWQVFEEGPRPVVFAADRGDMVYLKRKR